MVSCTAIADRRFRLAQPTYSAMTSLWKSQIIPVKGRSFPSEIWMRAVSLSLSLYFSRSLDPCLYFTPGRCAVLRHFPLLFRRFPKCVSPMTEYTYIYIIFLNFPYPKNFSIAVHRDNPPPLDFLSRYPFYVSHHSIYAFAQRSLFARFRIWLSLWYTTFNFQ